MGYRIKTVSKLTGVPRNTLLAWERRYDLITPSRLDNGYREYSDSDIACLQSVKRLLDQGYKVSEAINLIKTAREQAGGSMPVPGSVRIAIIHASFLKQIEAANENIDPLNIVHSADNVAAFEEAARDTDASADLVIADIATLGNDPVQTLRRCQEAVGAEHALVLYQFATYSSLQRLVRAGVRLVHGPTRVAMVRQAIDEQMALNTAILPQTTPLKAYKLEEQESAKGVPRRFTDAQLARLKEMRSSVDCECPNHLANLVSALLAFEQYSRDCEDRNEDDARLHAYLHHGTGKAREMMEELLEAVVVQDRLDI